MGEVDPEIDADLDTETETDTERKPAEGTSLLGTLRGLTQDYNTIKLIGEGATAKVYLCRQVEKGNSIGSSTDGDGENNQDGGSNNQDKDVDKEKLVAVKVLSKSILKKNRELGCSRGALVADDGLNKVQEEIAIMKKLQHDNIVKLVEVIDDDEHCFIVMDYVQGGPVMEYNSQAQKYETPGEEEPMTNRLAASVFQDILCGLTSLHTNFIVHRDLKPENILRDRHTGCAKIADFGVAKLLDEPYCAESQRQMSLSALSKSSQHAQVVDTQGTWCFWAPEVCEEDSYNGFAADIWAAGVCLWLFVYHTLPFHDPLPTVLFDKICSPEPLPFPDGDGSEEGELLRDLLSKLLEKDPSKRITLKEARAHPWLTAEIFKLPDRKPEDNTRIEVSQREREEAITRASSGAFKQMLKRVPSRIREMTSGIMRKLSGASKEGMGLSFLGMSTGGQSQSRHSSNEGDEPQTWTPMGLPLVNPFLEDTLDLSVEPQVAQAPVVPKKPDFTTKDESRSPDQAPSVTGSSEKINQAPPAGVPADKAVEHGCACLLM